MTPFQSLPEYETFVYTLPQQVPSILRSTLIVARRGRLLAELGGELAFAGGHRLVVYERLSWDAGPLSIEGYSYEVWRGSEKLYWYGRSRPYRRSNPSPLEGRTGPAGTPAGQAQGDGGYRP